MSNWTPKSADENWTRMNSFEIDQTRSRKKEQSKKVNKTKRKKNKKTCDPARQIDRAIARVLLYV